MKYKYLLTTNITYWTENVIKTFIIELDKPIDEQYINEFQDENKVKIIAFSKFE